MKYKEKLFPLLAVVLTNDLFAYAMHVLDCDMVNVFLRLLRHVSMW